MIFKKNAHFDNLDQCCHSVHSNDRMQSFLTKSKFNFFILMILIYNTLIIKTTFYTIILLILNDNSFINVFIGDYANYRLKNKQETY